MGPSRETKRNGLISRRHWESVALRPPAYDPRREGPVQSVAWRAALSFSFIQVVGGWSGKTIRRLQSRIASVPAQISSLRISRMLIGRSESPAVSHRVMSHERDFV